MDVHPRPRAATLLVLLLLARPAAGQDEVVPIEVEDGSCRFTLRASHANDQFYLVVGSLAPAEQGVQVRVRTAAAAGPEQLATHRATIPAARRETLRRLAEQQEHARRQRREDAGVPAGTPPQSRVFHLFVKDQDLGNANQYVAVIGDLRAVGRHCQVYVDRDEPAISELDATVADIVRTFDEEVLPWANRHLGHARDVDRDGRFTILLSPWLGKLQAGKVALDGFVRGSDFHLELGSPFSNHCDMLYLNSRLRTGPYLRTLLAHEYTHAVVLCEHGFGRYLAAAAARDEEGWLNEGLAHLVESLHGYSGENLDHRVRAYRACPERYPLVVADYYHAGLWRTAGTRGSAYLFLRWCYEQAGPDLPRRLVQSSLHGIENLEVATQTEFAELFRGWAVAQMQAEAPRCHELQLAGEQRSWSLPGTALLYLHLRTPATAFTEVHVEGPADQPLQVTLLRRPASATAGLRSRQ